MINGILPVHKPEGLSSARVVDRVKKALGIKKAGHTGTLDPFATGLLPVALGKATRLSRFFLNGVKTYRARVTLGIETDTYDKTGRTVSRAEPLAVAAVTPDRVEETVAAFAGVQEQTAPAFSALKHKGQPLYKLARQGKIIQKPPRMIEIFDIRVTATKLPDFEMLVTCSAGTYIRSLAHDMGKILGCGAHLSGLVRTGVSQFHLDQCVGMTAFEKTGQFDRYAVLEHMVPMADCISFMPHVTAGRLLAQKIRHGGKLSAQDLNGLSGKKEGFIRILGRDNRLLAVIEPVENGPMYNYCCVFNE